MKRKAKLDIFRKIEKDDNYVYENDGKPWLDKDLVEFAHLFGITEEKIIRASKFFGRTPGAIQMKLFSLLDAGRFGSIKDCIEFMKIKEKYGIYTELCLLNDKFQTNIYDRVKDQGWNLNPKKEKLVFVKR